MPSIVWFIKVPNNKEVIMETKHVSLECKFNIVHLYGTCLNTTICLLLTLITVVPPP